MALALYAVCLVVGILVGLAGVGGILIPPALVLLSGLDAHTAMGTALASLLATGLAGTWLHIRLGSFTWRGALPYLLGGTIAWPAALANTLVSGDRLILLLACLILFAGVCALRPPRQGGGHAFWLSGLGLATIGAVTGVLAGLTGAGGPVLSIPWLIAVGVPPMTAVGMSMPYQIVTSVAGTLGNMRADHVDWALLPMLCLLLTIGYGFGIVLARHLSRDMLGRVIGLLCLGLGLFLMVR